VDEVEEQDRDRVMAEIIYKSDSRDNIQFK